MTAVTVVAGEHSAYILADGGWYGDDGSIGWIGSKIYTFDHLNMAFAGSGLLSAEIPDWFSEQPDQKSVLAGLPAMLQEETAYLHAAKARFPERFLRCERTPIMGHLFVAMWSHEAQEPQAYIIASPGHKFGPGYQPYTVRRVSAVEQPGVDPNIRPPLKARNADWALPVIKQQRRAKDDNGHCQVAAFAELVTIKPDGFEREIIHRWRMDKVGRRARSMSRPPKPIRCPEPSSLM